MTAALAAPPSPAPAPDRSAARRTLTLGAVALVSLVAFENLAVTTVMPTAAADLHGLRLYALAFAGPFATALVAMVVSGRWSDSRGPVAPLWTGVAWFGLGVLLAGLAPTMWLLVAGRAVQGFGSGLVTVALYVVVGRTYPSAERPRIFAAFAAAWVVPSLVGPVIAGLLADTVGWRWVFLSVPALLVPAALAMVPGLRSVGAPPGGRAHGTTEGGRTAGRTAGRLAGRRRLAAAGAAAVGVTLLHLGGQLRGAAGTTLLAVGLAGIAVFAPRLLPTGAFRLRRGLPTAIALRGLLGAAFVATEVFVPLILARQRGLSPAGAGAALTAAAVLWSIGSWAQGRSGERIGRVTLVRCGLAFVLAGTLAVAGLLVPGTPLALGFLGWGVAGLGMGLAYPTLGTVMLDLSPVDQQGLNSSTMQLADSLFSAAALAVGGSLFAVLVSAGGPVAYLSGPLISAVLAGLGVLSAGRIRPAGSGESGSGESGSGE